MHNPIRLARPAHAALAVAALTAPAAAQLYTQDFETNTTGQWTVRNATSDFAINFFFDYSTVGIPQAPSGSGTRGLRIQANLANGIFSGVSVSPNGQSFTGDYTLRFDWWSNFNGPLNVGGSGSANLSTFGIGTTGAAVQWPGSGPALHSIMFGAVGDGGSAADWRVYSPAATNSYPDGDPVYAAPSRNASDPYYAMFGNRPAPAAQIALFPQQTGNTQVGAPAFAWHDVVIRKGGNTVTWIVDGLPIAAIDLNTVTLGGGHIFFGHSDVNAASSFDIYGHLLLFTLIDNIRVTRLCNRADVDANGAINVDDIEAFVTLFLAGCE